MRRVLLLPRDHPAEELMPRKLHHRLLAVLIVGVVRVGPAEEQLQFHHVPDHLIPVVRRIQHRTEMPPGAAHGGEQLLLLLGRKGHRHRVRVMMGQAVRGLVHTGGCSGLFEPQHFPVFHRGERVTEGSHSNISILKDGVLRTAPLDCYILPGIARRHLLLAAGRLGIPVDETPFTLDDLRAADEVIVTSSTLFCVRADSFCGQPAGGRDPETFEKLRAAVMAEFEEATSL